MAKALEECLESVPGLVLATSLRGERSYEARGWRQVFGVAEPKPMLADTSFDLGSITKIVATTSTFMALSSTEKFSLENKVSTFIPEWVGRDKQEVTIRDLLLHRSGLWEWRPLYIGNQDPATVVTRIAEIPLRYPINEARHYSDLGFITLGRILMNISGESLSDLVMRQVINPLNLKSTRFAHPVSQSNVAATSLGDSIEREMVRSKSPYPVPESDGEFKDWREGFLCGEVNDGNAFHLFDGTSSHAGLFSNAPDLLQFGESILASLRGHGPFPVEVVKHFLQRGPDEQQSLGFRSWTDTYKECADLFFGHTGFPGTVLAISPRHDFVATLLTNRLHVKNAPKNTEDLWRPVLAELHAGLHSSVVNP